MGSLNDRSNSDSISVSGLAAARERDYESFIASAFRRVATTSQSDGNATSSNGRLTAEWVEDQGPVDPGEAERRDVLAALFKDNTEGYQDKAQAHRDVVTILKDYPALASEYFSSASGDGCLPIFHLLISRADLEIISETYALYPDSLALRQQFGNLPLHLACQRSSATIIDFLMTKYPEALSMPNDNQQYPIHMILERSAGDINEDDFITVVRKMLELCPESAGSESAFHRPLEVAIERRCPQPIIRYLAEKSRSYCQQLQLGERRLDSPVHWEDRVTRQGEAVQFYIDLDLARILGEVLATLKIKDFKCLPRRWSRGGFIHLMNVLETDSSIEKLCLSLPESILKNDFEAPEALQEMIENSKAVQDLTLYMAPSEEADDAILRSLTESLAQNVTIQSLSLENFAIEWETVRSFLTMRAPPREILLRNARVKAGTTPVCAPRETTGLSTVESLSIVRGTLLGDACLSNILDQTVRMPRLKSLLLHLTREGTKHIKVDITPMLVTKLRQNVLQELYIKTSVPVYFDPPVVLECLKENTSLLSLEYKSDVLSVASIQQFAEVLQNRNASLRCLDIWPLDLANGLKPCEVLLGYRARVNRFGRAEARDPETSLLDFVNLLGGVHEASPLEFAASDASSSSSPPPISQQKLSIQYDLMKEAPGLWSSANVRTEKVLQNSKKRKRYQDHKRV